MSLFQKAIETYDAHRDYALQNRDGQVMMAPIGHIMTRASIEISISQNGEFLSARTVDKTEPKIIIPATEASTGRTSAPCAHPLCDQIGYLMPQNDEKYQLYTNQLEEWAASEYAHPKLLPILTYVKSRRVLPDLVRCGLVSLNEEGRPKNDKDEKMMVCWRVVGHEPEACWLDQSLFDAFTKYYTSSLNRKKALCTATGANEIPAEQHPKGIVSINGNAKIISANDSTGFTYRGRFENEAQALTVGYEASQKAHNALRWLVDNQGVHTVFGGRTFLCWNPQGQTISPPHLPFMPTPEPVFRPSEYRSALNATLNSKKADLKISDDVVIAAFDAATTGRLSLTYYNEMQAHDFLQRLHDWDAYCCWPHWKFGIQSPSLRKIVDCAFGTQRGNRLETDDRVLRQQMQRLIACRVDKAAMSTDIVKLLTSRASNPQAYEQYVWEDILFVACAVIRKYRKDRFKEEWNMEVEMERKDRSYQFGRLLAVMEKVERDTYGSSEGREPNAIRLQSVFCQRPLDTAHNLEKHLEKAYFPRLNPGSRIWYKNIMGQIMSVINDFPSEEWNKPLDGAYLMGYYLQRTALYTKKNENNMEENENG